MRYLVTYGRTTTIELAEIEVDARDEAHAIEKSKHLVDELSPLDWETTEIFDGAKVHLCSAVQEI